MDLYTNKYIKAIKKSKTDEEIEIVINKIYDDGFQDGFNEG